MKITYRVIRLEDDPDDFQFGLFEVYEGERGEIWYAEEPEMKGNTVTEMRLDVDLMMQAFELPVIE